MFEFDVLVILVVGHEGPLRYGKREWESGYKSIFQLSNFAGLAMNGPPRYDRRLAVSRLGVYVHLHVAVGKAKF